MYNILSFYKDKTNIELNTKMFMTFPNIFVVIEYRLKDTPAAYPNDKV